MSTIDHVTIRVPDLAEATAFYDRVFDLLAFTGHRQVDPFPEWGDFSIGRADPEHQAATGLHIAFTADSQELVESWWRGMIDAGYRSDGEPGLRAQYSPDYYGAFILDPQGNSVEAVTHARAREEEIGSIDHLWIRVRDIVESRLFYETVAPVVGLRIRDGDAFRFHLASDRGSVALVQEAPASENIHLAFSAPDRATVDAFHAAALEAGFRDNGAPGERPEYHPGYYGAYLLDPDGNNVEAVFHDRTMTSMSATI
jgi:catechol 2,3-dioxygenase-like lactoylglutathione lyase family enzyme